jgi:hypothetical protein
MTDVLVRVLVPYSRFLEVRARRLRIVAELPDPAPQRPIDAAVASSPMANDHGVCAPVAALATGPSAGIQQR